MKKIMYLIFCLPFLLTACDVHEWPDTPETVKFHLRLNYETDMTEWHHLYDGTNTIEQRYGDTYDNYIPQGYIRHIVRAYPADKQSASNEYAQEFVFVRNMSDGYDFETTLELHAGSYRIAVWSELMENNHAVSFHETANFAKITLQGDHSANTDYRDAFAGRELVTLIPDILVQNIDTLDISMRRPLGKFEIITDDVVDFIRKEVIRLASRGDLEYNGEEDFSRLINIKDYKIMIYYVGFMQNAYSVLTDMAVDSATGVSFFSNVNQLSPTEASLGFDYVISNAGQSAVTIKIGVLDKENTLLNLSDPIKVPLQRDHHTIIRGTFMTTEASGGLSINPEFDGEFNLIFP